MARKSYDRIFRENIEQLVVPLAHRLLNLTIPALEEIPDDLHQTIERKPDFLKKAGLSHKKVTPLVCRHFVEIADAWAFDSAQADSYVVAE